MAVEREDLRDWHRLFGLLLTDFFTSSPFRVDVERDLSVQQQLLDVVIVRRGRGRFAGRLPDGLGLVLHDFGVLDVVVAEAGRRPGAVRTGCGCGPRWRPGVDRGQGRHRRHGRGRGGRRDAEPRIVRRVDAVPGVGRHPRVGRVRLVVEGELADDRMTLHVETEGAPEGLAERIAQSIRDVTKLRGEVALVAAGSLPNDGKVIDDRRRPG